MHNYKHTELLFALCTYLCADFLVKLFKFYAWWQPGFNLSCFTRQKQQQIPNTAAPMIFFLICILEKQSVKKFAYIICPSLCMVISWGWGLPQGTINKGQFDIHISPRPYNQWYECNVLVKLKFFQSFYITLL